MTDSFFTNSDFASFEINIRQDNECLILNYGENVLILS